MKEGAKVKRFLACAIALSFFFLFISPSVSAIADDESDASFWLNYWVEEHTGIDMKDIPVTAYGMSYADYIYRQTGYTVDYWVDNANNPSNFVENTDEYLNNILYSNSEFMKDLLSTTPIANTTSQVYSTNYNQRVNQDGDINVSGSNYWNSVYNNLSHQGYKDQYADVSNGSADVNVNNINFNFSYVGIGDYSYYSNSNNYASVSEDPFTSRPPFFNSFISSSSAPNFPIGKVTYNSNTYYFPIGTQVNIYSEYYDPNTNQVNNYTVIVSVKYWNSIAMMESTSTQAFIFDENINSVGSGSTSVKQPYQVGYINYNGNKVPVYTDPSLNPFTINDDGTVSYENDPTKYPIYIDPDELSPYGDLIMLQYIVNNYYGNDYNDFDPFSGDPNNRLTYPNSNTKDYTDGFNSIIAWLKKIYTKETDIIKYLKKIASGIPLSDQTDSDDNSDKFEDFVSMLSLFNGKNNNGFKQQFLDKIAYSQIQQNIDNFSTALFGSRTFNPDGSVNTSFGSISVTETPELLYTFQGSTYNFWTDLTLLNTNGDLTKAKEYVRFFVIFAFFMNLYRSLPIIIKNGQFIASHAAIPEHESNFVDPDLQSPFEFTQYDDTLIWLDNSYNSVSFDIPDNDDVWFRGG